MKLILILLVFAASSHLAAAQITNHESEKTNSASSATTGALRAITVDEMKKLLERTNKRPLLINFWATWCEPCRAEFPDLVQIDNDYRARGLEMLTLSLDDIADLKTAVPQFLAEMKAIKIPAYLLDVSDPGEAVIAVDPAWNGALPATFIFDGQGQLIYKHTGRIKPDAVRAVLDKTVSGKQ